MAACAFAGAVKTASGILRPLNILASSTYRNCVKNASLISALSTGRFGHIQTSVVSSTSRLITSEKNLTCGRTSVTLNRVAPLLPSVLKLPVRSLTYFSTRKGKRKTVKAVIYRFLRLHCGLWVRRKAGYKKKLWKKEPVRKKRLREFVFCNKTQSKLLDKIDGQVTYQERGLGEKLKKVQTRGPGEEQLWRI
uniref:Large ribosomal subunit protein bL35m n=1 Tax=Callithrix jacchus TaxID=9483 RepID=A0A8I3WT45_CALJA